MPRRWCRRVKFSYPQKLRSLLGIRHVVQSREYRRLARTVGRPYLDGQKKEEGHSNYMKNLRSVQFSSSMPCSTFLVSAGRMNRNRMGHLLFYLEIEWRLVVAVSSGRGRGGLGSGCGRRGRSHCRRGHGLRLCLRLSTEVHGRVEVVGRGRHQ